MIIKNVARDDDKVRSELSSPFTELLERNKTRLANPITGVLLKPRDSQTQVQVCRVKEANHRATLPIDIVLAPL